MGTELLAGIGAFLSGAGSVLGAWYVIKATRRRAEDECDKRLEALREGFRMRGET